MPGQCKIPQPTQNQLSLCSCSIVFAVVSCRHGYLRVLDAVATACSLAPCLNGGTCDDTSGTAMCMCTNAYTGLQCETGACISNHFGSSTFDELLALTSWDRVFKAHFQHNMVMCPLLQIRHKSRSSNIVAALYMLWHQPCLPALCWRHVRMGAPAATERFTPASCVTVLPCTLAPPAKY